MNGLKPGDMVMLANLGTEASLWNYAQPVYAGLRCCGALKRGELGTVVACVIDPTRHQFSNFREQLLILVGDQLGWSGAGNFVKAG